jgi:hypothetical protein
MQIGILKNTCENNKIKYLFINSKIDIEFIQNISLLNKTYYIIFNKIYDAKKILVDELCKLINNNIDFIYLSADKEIMLVHKNNIEIIDNIINIKKVENYHILFSQKSNKHEYTLLNDNYTDSYITLLTNYYKNYSSIFTNEYTYEDYKKLYEKIQNAYYFVSDEHLKFDSNYYNIRSGLEKLSYLWFENIVFTKNNIINDDIINQLNNLHQDFPIVKLNNIISIKGYLLPLIKDIYSITNSNITYPTGNGETELTYNDNTEQQLFAIKAYETIYNELTKIKDKTQTNIIKLITVSVLCDKKINEKILNVDRNNEQTLYEWFLLFSLSNNDLIALNICKIYLENKHYKYILEILSYLISKFKKDNFKLIMDTIDSIYNIIDRQIINKLLLTIFNFITRTDDTCISIFIKFLKKNYDNFSYENLFTIFPNEPKILDFFIYIVTRFNQYDNLKLDVFKKRAQIKTNLELLLEESKLGTYNLNEIVYLNTSNFFLSYHGVPSKDIFQLKCKLIRKICPELNYNIDTNFINNKIKICFISSFLNRYHSVYKDRHQVIKQLADIFDIYFITFDDLIDDVKNTFGIAKHIKAPRNLSACKQLLLNMNLDIIVYCELGMDNFCYLLAFMKLAKYQLNTWGHSDTSGIDTIDYFMSSKYYEIKNAQDHYSEKLILCDSLCTYYLNPVSKYLTFNDRYFYGFNETSIIYFCGQSIFKFNKVYYDYIIQILSSNINAVLIMLSNNHKNIFTKNINNHIVNRIHWFPPASHSEYLNYMHISDVILDTYPFGGCNSSLEAFALGKVIVTQPSIMINGRFTCGYYNKMELSEYVSHSKDEYINFAIMLSDKEYRQKIENKIISKSHLLFNDKSTIDSWTEFINSLDYYIGKH